MSQTFPVNFIQDFVSIFENSCSGIASHSFDVDFGQYSKYVLS